MRREDWMKRKDWANYYKEVYLYKQVKPEKVKVIIKKGCKT